MTGLRRGEVCGLRWANVDLDAARLHGRHQINMADGKMDHAEHPKSDRSRRTIDLDAATVAVLRRHRADQAARRLRVGDKWQDGEFVFCGRAGEPLNPESVANTFQREPGGRGAGDPIPRPQA